jgi:hypothetical protein
MATAKDYVRVMGKTWGGVPPEQMWNVWENHAKSYVRAFWKQEMGVTFPWKIRIGSGNRNTWLQGKVFTVNPNAGWHDINHDMSHFIHWRKTGLSHKGGHMSVERDGAQLIKRRFLESGPKPEKAKPEVSVVAKRAASVDRRIVGWEKKLKRAKNALKKLKKQKRYYVKKLAEDRLNFRLEPRKRAKRLNIFEFGEKHGVDVEKEDWGEGAYSYYVTPKDFVETEADPYYGDHYVHDAKEARERILHYASRVTPPSEG